MYMYIYMYMYLCIYVYIYIWKIQCSCWCSLLYSWRCALLKCAFCCTRCIVVLPHCCINSWLPGWLKSDSRPCVEPRCWTNTKTCWRTILPKGMHSWYLTSPLELVLHIVAHHFITNHMLNSNYIKVVTLLEVPTSTLYRLLNGVNLLSGWDVESQYTDVDLVTQLLTISSALFFLPSVCWHLEVRASAMLAVLSCCLTMPSLLIGRVETPRSVALRCRSLPCCPRHADGSCWRPPCNFSSWTCCATSCKSGRCLEDVLLSSLLLDWIVSRHGGACCHWSDSIDVVLLAGGLFRHVASPYSTACSRACQWSLSLLVTTAVGNT